MSLSCVSAQTKYVKIVVYRNELNTANVEEVYNIFAEDNLTTSLKNNQNEEFYMPVGSFRLRINEENSTALTVQCLKGNSYYFKVYRNFSLPTQPIAIVAVDSTTAKSEMKYVKKSPTKQAVVNKINNRNGIGVILEPGVGFHKVGLVGTTTGDEAMISFGGEGTIGLCYNYQISENFGWSNELQDQFSSLTPYLSNTTVTFDRGIVSTTPYFIIPLLKHNDQKLKLGAGLDYHFNPLLTLDTEKLINGFKDEWTYDNTLGYHFILFFDTKLGRYLRGHAGLKYSEVQYTFVKGNTFQPRDSDLKTPHGNSISGSFGLEYCF